MSVIKLGEIVSMAEKVSSIEEKYATKEELKTSMNILGDSIKEFSQYWENYQTTLNVKISDFLSQQLLNVSIIQAYVEKELLLQEVDSLKTNLYVETLISAPFYKRITKKQKAKLKEETDSIIMEKYKDRINTLNKRLSDLSEKSTKKS